MTQTTDALLEKLLEASQCEQANDLARARSLYEEILRVNAAGFHGTSARKALEALNEKTGFKSAVSPAAATLEDAANAPELTESKSEFIGWRYWRSLQRAWIDTRICE